MINFRIVAKIFSQVLILEGFLMLISAIVAFIYNDPGGSLVISGMLTIIAGGMVYSPLRKEEKVNGIKEGYLIVTGAWILMSLSGTMPYLLSGTITNFGDALFESVSGFTTTGATIIENIESCSRGILFWRSSTQWLGGLLFILISVSLLPTKQVNIQLAIDDFAGLPVDKINPSTKEVSKRLFAIYFVLTLLETLFLMIGEMDLFDAICHSMSTISTGGFSTRNEGIASFGSPYTLIVLTIFMFIAGSNITLFYFWVKKRFEKILDNHEFFFYLVLFLIFTFAGTVALHWNGIYSTGRSFLESAFQTVSMFSTTGFFHADYNNWGSFMVFSLVIMMIIGSSSGSAGGGLKMIRLLLAGKISAMQMKNTLHPNAIIPLRLGNKVVPSSMAGKVLIIVTFYFLILCLGAVVTSFMGYDLLSSFSLSASMLSNVGHSPGQPGPFETFSGIPMAGKQFFAFLMILGRLEFISVLILFTRGFYKK